jgi:hypothetical protein
MQTIRKTKRSAGIGSLAEDDQTFLVPAEYEFMISSKRFREKTGSLSPKAASQNLKLENPN